MSFREKTAWITLISIGVFLAAYYGPTLSGLVPANSWAAFHLFAVCMAGLILLQLALNLIAASLNPKEARTPRDEREQAIHARSHVIGYYVLMIGMAVTLIATHVPLQGDGHMDIIIRTVNLGVLFLLLAAASIAVAQIMLYRRGA